MLSPSINPKTRYVYTLTGDALTVCSYHSSSNVSATASSSTTSRPRSTVCAPTGSANRIRVTSFFQIRVRNCHRGRTGGVRISRQPRGQSLWRVRCRMISLSLCHGCCTRRMYEVCLWIVRFQFVVLPVNKDCMIALATNFPPRQELHNFLSSIVVLRCLQV